MRTEFALALGAVLLLGSLRGWAQAPPLGGPTVTLRVEVSLADGTVFYIPVVGDGEMVGVIPLSEGRFAGIRITPRMRVDSAQIDVAALSRADKKLSEATTAELRSWKSKDAGSYEGKENESLLLSGLRRLGLHVFRVKVARVGAPPPGPPPPANFPPPYANYRAFCGCEFPEPRTIAVHGTTTSGTAGTLSYPEPGKCAEISGGGQCCLADVLPPVQESNH